MEKNDFSLDGHYSVALRDASGKVRPANIYVHRLEDDHMIVRHTSGSEVGLLTKIRYDSVTRIARTLKVLDRKKFMIPAAMLNPKMWADRDTMRAYSSAPGLGK